MDAVVNGHRYREPLGTTDSRKAPSLERERISQLKDKAPDPTKKSKSLGSMPIADAIEVYINEGMTAEMRKRNGAIDTPEEYAASGPIMKACPD